MKQYIFKISESKQNGDICPKWLKLCSLKAMNESVINRIALKVIQYLTLYHKFDLQRELF